MRGVDPKSVLASMPSARRARSAVKGIACFLIGASVLVAGLAIVVVADSGPILCVGSALTALATSMLFIVGHDACHGNLVPHDGLNRWIARLAFMPSLHPLESWRFSHNALHHSRTNVRGGDIVFVPFSRAEYLALPLWRRAAERFWRSLAGVWLFYFCTVYIPYEIGLARQRLKCERAWARFRLDRVLVISYLIGMAVVLSMFADAGALAGVGFGLLLPLAGFQAAMSFVSYIHHTHPKIPWFGSPRQYDYFQSQVCGSSHVRFPWFIEAVLLHILDHAAHHSDPRIPLYNLKNSQSALEAAYPGCVVEEIWTVRGFLLTLRTCRLYDYEAHRWLDWDGTPLTPSLLPPLAPHRKSQ